MTREYFVYIVCCADGTFYTGWTVDVARRVHTHNRGRGSRYTRARRPVVLVYSEVCASRAEAQRRELAVKKLARRAKKRLIEKMQLKEREGSERRAGERERTA